MSLYECAYAENQMRPNRPSDDTLDMHAENQMCPNPSSDDILDSTKNCTVQQLTQSVQPTTADSQRVMVSIHGLLHWNIWQRANQSGSWPQRRCASASSNLHAFSMLHSLGVEPIHSCIRQPCCCQRKVGAFENSLKQKGTPQKCHVLNNEFLLCLNENRCESCKENPGCNCGRESQNSWTFRWVTDLPTSARGSMPSGSVH